MAGCTSMKFVLSTPPHRLHDQPVFHFLDALVQALLRIPRLDGNFFAADDGSGVDGGSYVMDGAARRWDVGLQGLAHGMEAAKDGDGRAVAGSVDFAGAAIGQEGRMQVDDTPGELGQEGCAEYAHPAREYDEVDLEEVQEGSELRFALRHFRCFGWRGSVPGQVDGGQFVTQSALQANRVGFVAHDEGDFDAGKLAAFDGIDEGLQVAAAAGDEDAEAEGFHSLRTSSSAEVSSALMRCLYCSIRCASCWLQRASILAASRAAPSGSRIVGVAMPEGSRNEERISMPPKRSL